MHLPIKLTESDFRGHVADDDGLCLACGEWAFGSCEPDAEDYPCEVCGEHRVMGAENALIYGHVEFVKGEEEGA